MWERSENGAASPCGKPFRTQTEYRVYKGSDWADSEISLDLEDLVAELAALCDPYYEHEQPIYEL